MYTGIFLLISCDKQKESNASIITFQPKENIDFNVEFEVLTLNTPESLLVGIINSVQLFDNRIYLLDSNSGMLVFDIKGNFISKIGNKGRGPGEYISSRVFSIDEYNGMISIIDNQVNKIINFKIEDYSLIGETYAPNNSLTFEALDQNSRVWFNGNYSDYKNKEDKTYGFDYFVTQDDVITDVFSKRKYNIGFITGPAKQVYKIGETVKAYSQHSPYLYKIDKNGLIEEYKIEVKGMPFATEEFLNNIVLSQNFGSFYSNLTESEYISYTSIYETNDNLLFFGFYKLTPYVGVYDKYSRVTEMSKQTDFEQQHMVKLGYLCGASNNAYIFAVDPPTEDDNVSDEFNEKFSKSNSNSSLLFVRFKE